MKLLPVLGLVAMVMSTEVAANPVGVAGLLPQSTWGMTYQITIMDGQFVQYPWDEDSAPDFKVVLEIDGTPYETRKVQDSWSPVWNTATRAVINASTRIVVKLIDVDALSDDTVATWNLSLSLSLAWLAQTAPHELVLNDSLGNKQGTIRLSVAPVAGS
jgi:hypothetical protein